MFPYDFSLDCLGSYMRENRIQKWKLCLCSCPIFILDTEKKTVGLANKNKYSSLRDLKFLECQ